MCIFAIICAHIVGELIEQYGPQYQSLIHPVFTCCHLYVKPLAITLHIPQSQGFKTLCIDKEGTGKQNDMKC